MSALRAVVAAVVLFAGLAAQRVPATETVADALRSPAAATTDAAFTDVSCRTARFCIAVGYHDGSPIARRWDGRSWHPMGTPHRHGSLSSVWCTGKSHCLAVGHRTSSMVTHALAERWDGRHWRTVRAADHPSSSSTSLESITCRSTRDCVSTGSYGDNGGPRRTLAESWDGIRWTIVATSNPPVRVTGNDLSAVSCTVSVRCVAVGVRGRGTVGSRVLAETWTGSAWQAGTMANPGGAKADSSLGGVSCSRTARVVCMAVGNVNTGGATKPLAEKWTGGAWHRGHPLRRGGDHGDQLTDVACVSATRCVAVGSASTGGTLTEIWNEHGWKILPSARLANRYNGLQAVSCSSATHCLAVGFNEKPDDSVHPLAERWNGSSWRVVTP